MSRAVFRLSVADERLTSLHAELHEAGGHARQQSLAWLPECILHLLDHSLTKGTRIGFGQPLTLLDYGSGHSTLVDWVGRIIDAHQKRLSVMHVRSTTRELWEEVLPSVTFVMDRSAHGVLEEELVAAYEREFGVAKWPRTKVVKFDPAVPELSKFSVTEAHFVYCLNVLASVPVLSRSFGRPTRPLANTLNMLAALSRGIFMVTPNTLSPETLPNHGNAHCTIMSGEEWHETLKLYWNEQASPVLSRDMTAVAFTSWQPSSFVQNLQYQFAATYGLIDRIPQPSPALPSAKQRALKALQNHKLATIFENAQWWAGLHPSALREKGIQDILQGVRLPIAEGTCTSHRERLRLC
jgi:hypothetical protein